MEFSPRNKLEEVLILAATEPAHRPEFFSELMEATVFVLGTTDDGDESGEVVLHAGSNVNIQHWEKDDGSSAIPFFSSLEALQSVITEEAPFLALPTRSLFEMTQGVTLFLNPKLPYGKEFLPQEIEHILSGEGNGFVQQRVVEEEMQVILSQPAEMPAQMIDSLTQLFTKHRHVKRAFLAQIQEPGEEQPHLLIGIDAEQDEETIIREAGSVASDTLPDERPVDLCLVKEGEPGISHYMIKHTTPFYERKWGSFLREFKATGNA
ncbi:MULTISPECIES: enhanced serine sensitivity protein SseB [Pectobacterium]|uniref:Enhanced serine sensitivity protein SseB n=2 Tax=Pectobacterium TaxID=122277 RepID=A0A3R8Q994_9GAMM|nr:MULTISPECIES: enhanced serine sensitivity protein SseB [Pectobacterium]ASN84629.1 SseB protein [Pectobacterium versatile]MBA0159601.1 enhanced serine sensitivity protein SseB [Pectobacterium versatile]MBA0170547.1 enhanced serine sensitivity protein SseB [Pectobacterium versatile]MBQ4764465.1 enhanced serine sensitivity protein SseB [Pectobacterium versatile]MBQ4781990.1 enhanced serine sensitivity protein SseB [Pectobacterium versatile]